MAKRVGNSNISIRFFCGTGLGDVHSTILGNIFKSGGASSNHKTLSEDHDSTRIALTSLLELFIISGVPTWWVASKEKSSRGSIVVHLSVQTQDSGTTESPLDTDSLLSRGKIGGKLRLWIHVIFKTGLIYVFIFYHTNVNFARNIRIFYFSCIIQAFRMLRIVYL